MSNKLHHPLWTHLPGLICVIAIAWVLARLSLPDRVPMQFDASGRPSSWGSPVKLWLCALGVPLLVLIGSAVLDEVNARHETTRRFNWMAILDDLGLGVALAIVLRLAPVLTSPQPVFTFPWRWMMYLGGGAALLAGLLESLRPHRPAPQEPQETYAMPATEAEQIARGPGRWLYWETQNPGYLRVLIPLVTTVLVLGFIQLIPVAPVVATLDGIAALFVLAVYGGLRVTVTPDQIVVRLGVLGIPLRRIRLRDVEHIEAVSFAPLADFGGWGPGRYSPRLKAWGFYLRGHRGVMVQTRSGSKALIGSDTPERLAAFSQKAMEMASK